MPGASTGLRGLDPVPRREGLSYFDRRLRPTSSCAGRQRHAHHVFEQRRAAQPRPRASRRPRKLEQEREVGSPARRRGRSPLARPRRGESRRRMRVAGSQSRRAASASLPQRERWDAQFRPGPHRRGQFGLGGSTSAKIVAACPTSVAPATMGRARGGRGRERRAGLGLEARNRLWNGGCVYGVASAAAENESQRTTSCRTLGDQVKHGLDRRVGALANVIERDEQLYAC